MIRSRRSLISWCGFSFLLAVPACAPETDDSVTTTASLVSPPPTVLYETSAAKVVQDGDWVRWSFSHSLGSAAEHTTYRGARGKDGNCNFQGGGSVAKAAPGSVIIERAVSTNINQCLMETERTTLPVADAVARGLVAAGADGGATSLGATVEGGSELQLQDGFQFSGHFKSKFIDPVSLDVNWASANIDWSSNGSCMTGWHRWDSYYWLTATGWGRGGYGQDGTPGGTLPCNEIWQKVWANYYNYWFCGLTPTYANHNNSQYHAFADGGSSWSWDVWWGGACYWLLAFNTEVDFN